MGPCAGGAVSFAVWDGTAWRLKEASLADGVVRTLSDRLNLEVTDWGPEGEIYFRDMDQALWRIPSSGGDAERIAAPLEHHVGIEPVPPRNLGDRRSRFHRLRHHPPLERR